MSDPAIKSKTITSTSTPTPSTDVKDRIELEKKIREELEDRSLSIGSRLSGANRHINSTKEEISKSGVFAWASGHKKVLEEQLVKETAYRDSVKQEKEKFDLVKKKVEELLAKGDTEGAKLILDKGIEAYKNKIAIASTKVNDGYNQASKDLKNVDTFLANTETICEVSKEVAKATAVATVTLGTGGLAGVVLGVAVGTGVGGIVNYGNATQETYVFGSKNASQAFSEAHGKTLQDAKESVYSAIGCGAGGAIAGKIIGKTGTLGSKIALGVITSGTSSAINTTLNTSEALVNAHIEFNQTYGEQMKTMSTEEISGLKQKFYENKGLTGEQIIKTATINVGTAMLTGATGAGSNASRELAKTLGKKLAIQTAELGMGAVTDLGSEYLSTGEVSFRGAVQSTTAVVKGTVTGEMMAHKNRTISNPQPPPKPTQPQQSQQQQTRPQPSQAQRDLQTAQMEAQNERQQSITGNGNQPQQQPSQQQQANGNGYSNVLPPPPPPRPTKSTPVTASKPVKKDTDIPPIPPPPPPPKVKVVQETWTVDEKTFQNEETSEGVYKITSQTTGKSKFVTESELKRTHPNLSLEIGSNIDLPKKQTWVVDQPVFGDYPKARSIRIKNPETGEVRYVTCYEVLEASPKNWQGNSARPSFLSGDNIELSHDRFPEPQKKQESILDQGLDGDLMRFYKGEKIQVKDSRTNEVEHVDIHQLDIEPGSDGAKKVKKGDKVNVFIVDKIDIPPEPDFFGNDLFQRQLKREASLKALGLDEFGEYTIDEARKAYRKISRANHPDVKPEDEEALKRFKEAQEAWDFLEKHGVAEGDDITSLDVEDQIKQL